MQQMQINEEEFGVMVGQQQYLMMMRSSIDDDDEWYNNMKLPIMTRSDAC